MNRFSVLILAVLLFPASLWSQAPPDPERDAAMQAIQVAEEEEAKANQKETLANNSRSQSVNHLAQTNQIWTNKKMMYGPLITVADQVSVDLDLNAALNFITNGNTHRTNAQTDQLAGLQKLTQAWQKMIANDYNGAGADATSAMTKFISAASKYNMAATDYGKADQKTDDALSKIADIENDLWN